MPLEPDWDDFAALAHRAVDDIVAHFKELSSKPTWQEPPASVRERILSEPLPEQGQGENSVYADFVRDVMPYPNGNIHPRYFGWVQGSGLPFGALADFLASCIDPHMAGFNQSPRFVEERLLEWMVQLMGFPEFAGGVFESGGTMANTIGLHVAHGHMGGGVVYCTAETHGWVQKAVKFLGIGLDSIHLVATDDQYRMSVESLRAAVVKDRQAGLHPAVVVATSGTVQTGAFDDLGALYDLTREEIMWLHVDAAFGAALRLVPSHRHLVAGIEKADSMAFDLHKWFYLPFEIACLLVSNIEFLTDAFVTAPAYISGLRRGVISGGLPFYNSGMDLTRNFKTLKAWMCLKAYGLEAFAAAIERNLAQTRLLVDLIEASDCLELSAPVAANVCCFRYVGEGMTLKELNALNLETLLRLQESGDAVVSSTTLGDKFVLRYCNVNHRTTDEDIRKLVDSVERHGRAVLAEG